MATASPQPGRPAAAAEVRMTRKFGELVSEPAVCCAQFKDVVQPNMLGMVVVEVLKYLLYERGQIPLPYEQLRRYNVLPNVQQWMSAAAAAATMPNHYHGGGHYGHHCFQHSMYPPARPKSLEEEDLARCTGGYQGINGFCKELQKSLGYAQTYRQLRQQHKILKAISIFDDIFQDVIYHVSRFPVREVLFLLGSTPFNPKEIYLIQLPAPSSCPVCKEKSKPSLNSCMTQLFKMIVMASGLKDTSTPPLTKVTIMLRMLIKAPFKDTLEPKITYTVPTRGKKVIFCLDNPDCDHMFEIYNDSEPASCGGPPKKTNFRQRSFERQQPLCNGFGSSQEDSIVEKMKHCKLDSSEAMKPPDEYIWVQVGPSVKGVKSGSQETSVDDIWA